MTDTKPTLTALPRDEDAEHEAKVREAYMSLARAIRGPQVRPKRARNHLKAV